MPTELKRTIRRETLVATVISALISAAFVFALFGGRDPAPLWGARGAAIDFLPQTFMLSLMSALIPALVMQRKVARGQLEALPGRTRGLPRQPIVRSLLLALLATLVGGLCGTAVTWMIAGPSIAFATLLEIKVIYGGLIAAAVARTSMGITLAHAWRLDSRRPRSRSAEASNPENAQGPHLR
ncbi:hypothetical protein [Halomonas sp. B23F22_10]|uniref:hypothetical protein n=1 Tax=Halomonas sp. B23F22_10 TaxID=3459515 RepID=UPI00373E2F0B